MSEKTKSSSSSAPTLESLQSQIDQLTKLVEKQNKIILSTGEKLMQLQLQQQKDKHKELESGQTSKSSDDNEYVTNEDIVQLVGELQGQLLTLDYKSFSRVANSSKGFNEPLEIVPNHDGEYPNESIYPTSKLDFKNFDALKVYILAQFYELIPPVDDEEVDEIVIKCFNGLTINSPEIDVLKKDMNLTLPEKKDKQSLYNRLAIYLGVEIRKE